MQNASLGGARQFPPEIWGLGGGPKLVDIATSYADRFRPNPILAAGLLSHTYQPPWPGVAGFRGEVHTTSRWPTEPGGPSDTGVY